MKRFLAILLLGLMVSSPSYAITDWRQGSNTTPLQGTSQVSDIDTNSENYAFAPLDRLLSYHIRGCSLTWTSTTVVTVAAGEVTCLNGAGTIKRMRQNTVTTTVNTAIVGVGGIDSGSHAGAIQASTWYSVYAVADSAATTFTAIAAEQGVALSDVTYYRYIGSVLTDGSKNLLGFEWFGYGPDVLIMWNIPVSLTTTPSLGAWSSALSCTMPSTAVCGIFGTYVDENNYSEIYLRPNGSTWNILPQDGNYTGVVGTNPHHGAQRICMTDSSQQIQYYNTAASSTTNNMVISLEGYYFNR